MKIAINTLAKQANLARSFKHRIGVVQSCSKTDCNANYQFMSKEISECAKNGAEMVFIPENFSHSGMGSSMEEIQSSVFKNYRELAKQYKVWLSLGGFNEKSHTPGKRFNSHIILNEQGEIIANYRKLHLFDVKLGEVN